MVTSTLLRRYPLFSFLKPAQLKILIACSEEESYAKGDFIFKEGDRAEWLYILVKGGVDLLFSIDVPMYPEQHKELHFGSVPPGDLFGISALIEPFVFTSSARASQRSKVVKIHSAELLDICCQDEKLGFILYSQTAKCAMERLSATRLQLAAARAKELS